jgi:hypothetical protein
MDNFEGEEHVNVDSTDHYEDDEYGETGPACCTEPGSSHREPYNYQPIYGHSGQVETRQDGRGIGQIPHSPEIINTHWQLVTN